MNNLTPEEKAKVIEAMELYCDEWDGPHTFPYQSELMQSAHEKIVEALSDESE